MIFLIGLQSVALASDKHQVHQAGESHVDEIIAETHSHQHTGNAAEPHASTLATRQSHTIMVCLLPKPVMTIMVSPMMKVSSQISIVTTAVTVTVYCI